MIYIERTIKIKKGEASIDEPVCLYKGDKNIEIRFLIENNPFKYKNDLTVNYGQLIIKRENAPDIFSEPTKISGGRVVFLITGDMINDLNELGSYTFQIRILNEDLTSRGTLPPVFAGITIKEPLCEEPLEPPKVYINPEFYEIRTKGGTDYSYLFYNCDVEQIPDFSTWDTSNVTDMTYMFGSCNFVDPNTSKMTKLDLSSFDVSNVTSTKDMFNNVNYMSQLNITGWNTRRIINMTSMFCNCRYLYAIIGELDLSSLGSGVNGKYSMDNIFYGCNWLQTVYLKNIYKNCTMKNDSKWSIDLSDTKVKDECLVYIINELPDLINDKGLAATDKIVLTLPKTNTLTEEQVQVAVDKGWSVANTTY
jgi:surface protein